MKRFVDKANQNCFRIPYLFELFPDAIFIYVKRDGRDNINSLIHGWGKPNEFATWSQDIPADIQIENGTYRQWAFFLFPGWRSFVSSSIEEVCAQQWITANQSVLVSKREIPQRQWIEVFYEDMLTSSTEAFRRIFEKLNLRFTDEIKQHCDSLIEHPYNAFSPPRLNKWKVENRDRIEHVLPLINPTMREMRY
jgi:hypothetical protein